ANVDDLERRRELGRGAGRLAGGQRQEQRVHARQVLRLPCLDRQVGVFRQAGEVVAQTLTGAGCAADVGQLELRVRDDEAQNLATAITRNPDDANFDAHISILPSTTPTTKLVLLTFRAPTRLAAT